MPSIYISAVPEEFASYRDQLAVALRRRGCSVAWSGTFEAGGDTKLDKVHRSLKLCDHVICLMGERYGDEPTKEESSTMGTLKHSYTQWEYVLAKREMVPLHVFFPQPQAPRDTDDPENKARRTKQEKFWHESIEAAGVPRVSVADPEEFVAEVLDTLTSKGLIADEIENHSDPWERELKSGCPYQGLRPFEAEDQEFFRGRDKQITELLSRLNDHPFSFLLGHSGVGKTSLLRAGITPKFEEHYQDRARVLHFSPGKNPYEELTRVMAASGFDREQVATFTRPHLADLERNEEFSTNVFRELEKRFQKTGERWLILIDHFEQLFSGATDPELRECFIASILDCVKASTGDSTILVAMRDDYYGEVHPYPALSRLMDENLCRIHELGPTDLRDAIEGPAARHGVVFEAGLIDRIGEDLYGKTGVLPRLQFTLQSLWSEENVFARVLKTENYDAIGGFEQALELMTETLHNRLNQHEERAIRNMILPLVQVDAKQSNCNPSSCAMPQSVVLESGDPELLNRLEYPAGLVNQREVGNETMVELAHGSLASDWPQLRRWIRDYRDAILLHRQLKRDAKKWDDLRKAEKWTESRDELWRGSRVARIEELDTEDQFTRALPLGQNERRFLDACVRRKELENVIALRKRLRLSAERWRQLLRERRRREAKKELWKGVELDSALQNHGNGRFQEISDFADLGALQQVDLEFLKACQAHRNGIMTRLRGRLAFASIGFLLMLGVLGWEVLVARQNSRVRDGSPSSRILSIFDNIQQRSKPPKKGAPIEEGEAKPAEQSPSLPPIADPKLSLPALDPSPQVVPQPESTPFGTKETAPSPDRNPPELTCGGPPAYRRLADFSPRTGE